MIPERLKEVKEWCSANKSDLFTAALIFLVGMGGFGLGRLSAVWPGKTPLVISGSEKGSAISSSSPAALNEETRGRYVGSKSGTSYHYPWCLGAQKIKEGNKIWFATKEEAAARGYKPASNCPGL